MSVEPRLAQASTFDEIERIYALQRGKAAAVAQTTAAQRQALPRLAVMARVAVSHADHFDLVARGPVQGGSAAGSEIGVVGVRANDKQAKRSVRHG